MVEPTAAPTGNPASHKSSQNEDAEEIKTSSSRILYDILGVAQTATSVEIKKAYRRLALLKHPDKCPNDPQAADNFQKLNKAYSVLSDAAKRKRYDEYGDDGEDGFNSTEWVDAYEYYRAMHPEVTKQDVRDFASRYQRSTEEEQDLVAFYEENEGDISLILQCIMCSENSDLPRFVEFFDKMIKEGELEETALYTASKGKVVTLDDEADEAKAAKKKLKQKKAAKADKGKENQAQGMESLQAMILAKRQNAAGGFLSYMEQKYCAAGVGDDDDDEVEFEAVKPGSKKRRVKKAAEKPKAGGNKKRKA